MPAWVHDRYEAEVARRPTETSEAAFERTWEAIAAYRIFPESALRSVLCPPGVVARGTIIVQRFQVGGITLEAAVQVTDRWDEQTVSGRRAGFSYVTLRGHPERGVETFEVRSDAVGRVTVVIEARSRAGSWVTRVGRQVARRLQVSATRAALAALTR